MPREAKSITDIRAEARKHTAKALRVLSGIASQPKAPPAARVSAATALLDRAWGKPAQAVTGEDGEGPVNLKVTLSFD